MSSTNTTTTTTNPHPLPNSPSKPLASRDVNASTSSTKANATENGETKSMDYHRQILQNRLASEKGAENVYISPSDTIMSPCTKKLNGLKMGRFGRAKPQNLFAKIDKDGKIGAGGQGEGAKEEEAVVEDEREKA
ncbi:hypothetical protein N7G274_008780 [Stereocaulon virgatum]|uniref:Uncharacterized protein n=1 Tax=Stereocaulon virgatum TaxID=373712 RepID=A0ABR3ZZK0_9LECA